MIDRARIAANWSPHNKADQRVAVAVWFDIFSKAKVPARAVAMCYDAAVELRRKERIAGERISAMPSADYVADMWEMSVRAKLDEIEASQRLATADHSGCPDCYGNEYRRPWKRDETGRMIGIDFTRFCMHDAPGYDPNAED